MLFVIFCGKLELSSGRIFIPVLCKIMEVRFCKKLPFIISKSSVTVFTYVCPIRLVSDYAYPLT